MLPAARATKFGIRIDLGAMHRATFALCNINARARVTLKYKHFGPRVNNACPARGFITDSHRFPIYPANRRELPPFDFTHIPPPPTLSALPVSTVPCRRLRFRLLEKLSLPQSPRSLPPQISSVTLELC